MKAALTRYRIAAWIVGVLLLALTLVAMPMKYFAHNDLGVALIAPVHGWMFVLYLIAAGDLARRSQWSVTRMLLVGIAGTIPFLSFVIERQVRQWVQIPGETQAASAS